MEPGQFQTTWQLTLRFWRAASGLWGGAGAWKAWLLGVLSVATVLAQLAIQFRLNYWSRNFFDAFGRRDSSTLSEQAIVFLPPAVASIAVAVLALWTRMTM
jgi:putative ATP-binding cassette transporter